MAEAAIRARDVRKSMRVDFTIKGYRVMMLRFWLCVQIVKFAARIGGFGIVNVEAVNEQ